MQCNCIHKSFFFFLTWCCPGEIWWLRQNLSSDNNYMKTLLLENYDLTKLYQDMLLKNKVLMTSYFHGPKLDIHIDLAWYLWFQLKSWNIMTREIRWTTRIFHFRWWQMTKIYSKSKSGNLLCCMMWDFTFSK